VTFTTSTILVMHNLPNWCLISYQTILILMQGSNSKFNTVRLVTKLVSVKFNKWLHSVYYLQHY